MVGGGGDVLQWPPAPSTMPLTSPRPAASSHRSPWVLMLLGRGQQQLGPFLAGDTSSCQDQA